MLKTVYRIEDVPYLELKYLAVNDREEAREIFEMGGYSKGWYYRPRKFTKWLLIKNEEYVENNKEEQYDKTHVLPRL